MAKNKTLVSFVLDKSGSMGSVKDATISGFNEYVGTLKKDKKSDYLFSLTMFNDKPDRVIINKPIAEVEELNADTYVPDGMTALYDAVCMTIKQVELKKGDKAIMVIMTDGAENSSRQYDEKKMKQFIEDCETSKKWTFVYLGANQDSYAVAAKYGIHRGNVSNFNASASGMNATMRSVANNTVNFSAQSASSTAAFFSKEDQDNLESTK